MVKRIPLQFTDDNVNLFISRFNTGRLSCQNALIKNTGVVGYTPIGKIDLNAELVTRHLKGEETYGAYIITPQNTCKFAVIDFDVDTLTARQSITKPGDRKAKEKLNEALIAVQAVVRDVLKNASEKLMIDRGQMLVERSGSKGYHIWLFFAEPVEAVKAWRLTRVLSGELGLDKVEMFPVQQSADDEHPGSLIKLPMGIHKKTNERCLFLDDNFEPQLDQWMALQNTTPINAAQLNNLLKLQETEADRIEDDSVDDVTTIGGSIDRMIDSCAALKELRAKSERPDESTGLINLTHNERLVLLSLFGKFGEVGRLKIHQFIKNTHNYNQDKTERAILSSTMAPMRCCKLQEYGICRKECQAIVDAGGTSPIKLSVDKSKSSTSALVLHSLAEIENPVLCRRRVRVEFVVTAMMDNPYCSIKKATFKPCEGGNCAAWDDCTFETKTGSKVVTVNNNRKEHIQMYGADDSKALGIVRRMVGCPSPRNLQLESMEDHIVQPFACGNIIKMPGQVSEDEEESADADSSKKKATAAKENKDYIAFFLGNSLETSKVYRGWGTVLPNPLDRALTILFDKVEPIYGQIDNFEVTEANRPNFELFKAMTLEEKIEDIRENIAMIRDRDNYLFAIMLTHFSVLDFVFNSVRMRKGWLELIAIGDSGQAKSLMVEKIVEYIGLGRIEGSNASLAGLLGGVNKLQNKSYLQWGVFPKCNKGLLFLDEVQKFHADIWNQLRTARTTGVAKIIKINQGEHESRVRLICAANPKPQEKLLTEFKYGALALASVLEPPDIRRFDLACFLGLKDLDQKKDLVNVYNNPQPPRLGRKILRDAIMWAWSRKLEHIIISKEVTEKILKVSKQLSDKFDSPAVPLCNRSDMREKLARMVVACAAMHMRTDDYVHLKPTLEDVDIIVKFLTDLYSHPNVALDAEAAEKRNESDIDDYQYDEIKNIIISDRYKKLKKVMDGFTTMKELRPQDLASWVDIKQDEMSKIVTLLGQYNLICMSQNRSGVYQATAKLRHLLKRLNAEKEAENGGIPFQ